MLAFLPSYIKSTISNEAHVGKINIYDNTNENDTAKSLESNESMSIDTMLNEADVEKQMLKTITKMKIMIIMKVSIEINQ